MEEIAAWLREQAEADIKAAAVATDGPWEARAMQVWGATRAHAGGRSGEVLVVGHTWAQEAGHIVRHDPLTETARAESVLAVLGAHETARKLAEAAWEQGDEAAHSLGDQARALRRAVRLLAYGYRERGGWRETWKP